VISHWICEKHILGHSSLDCAYKPTKWFDEMLTLTSARYTSISVQRYTRDENIFDNMSQIDYYSASLFMVARI